MKELRQNMRRDSTLPCQQLEMGVPVWQVGRAEGCGVIFQGVAPRVMARPKGLFLGNLDSDRLLLKY